METKAVFHWNPQFLMGGSPKINMSAYALKEVKGLMYLVYFQRTINYKPIQLQAYSTTATICSDLMIAFLDDFANGITQKTVVVLDNAPIHHSEEFQQQLIEWEKQDLYIFFLPTYSPHLNFIERLWLKSKYKWLKPKDYQSFDILNQAVETIMNQIGKKLKIDFNEPNHFTQFKTAIN